jgi:hypothetical protein
MRTDHYDVGPIRETAQHRWLYLAPGMWEEMQLWTDEDFRSNTGIDPSRWTVEAGTWRPLKDGIAIRLGRCLTDLEGVDR